MQSQGEAFLGNFTISLYLCMTVSLESFVGCCVDGVFDMYAEALVLSKVRVRQQCGPVAFWEVAFKHGQTAFRFSGSSQS